MCWQFLQLNRVFSKLVSIFPGAVFLERVKCILISFIVQCVNIISVSKVSVRNFWGGHFVLELLHLNLYRFLFFCVCVYLLLLEVGSFSL